MQTRSLAIIPLTKLLPANTGPRPNAAHRLQIRKELDRSVHIMARSLFRAMTAQGYESRHFIQLSTELIHLLTVSMQEARQVPASVSDGQQPLAKAG